MKEENEFFEDVFVDSERENEVLLFGEPPSREREAAARSFIRTMLNNPDAYRCCQSLEGCQTKLVVAHLGKMDGSKPAIVVTPFLVPPDLGLQRNIRAEVENIRSFFPEQSNIPILLRVNSAQGPVIETLTAMGSKLSAMELIGDIQRAVINLQKKETSNKTDYMVEPFVLEKDLQEVLGLVCLSSQSDPSCRTHDFSEKQHNEIEPFIKQSSEERLAFVVKRDGHIVGTIILFKQGSTQETVCVGFVGVHPDHQGQGISNLLYLRALDEARKMGFSRFSGFSTTKRVLSQNEKLARKIRSYHFLF